MSEVRFEVHTTEQLGSTVPGASGAQKIGIASIDGLNASQVQEALRLLAARKADPATAGELGVILLTTEPANPALPKAVGDNDGRMTDSRVPKGGAGGDLTGTYPDPRLAAVSPSPAGTYERATVTVDSKGRVTSAATGAAGSVPDASTTTKGANKLSVAPADAANPIAAGHNDPRLARGYVPIRAASYVYNGTLAASTTVISDDLRGSSGNVPFDAVGVKVSVSGHATGSFAYPFFIDGADGQNEFSPAGTTTAALPRAS